MSDRTDHTPAPTGASEDVTRLSLARSTDSPCPRWCLGPNASAPKDASHEWDVELATGASVRYHDAYRGAHVSVDVEERRGQDGVSTFGAPRVYGPDMDGQFTGAKHSPELLRAFGAELTAVSAVLEQFIAPAAALAVTERPAATCPAWCTEPPSHLQEPEGFVDHYAQGAFRMQVLEPGAPGCIDAVEVTLQKYVGADGQVTPPRLLVDLQGEALSPEDAILFAEGLQRVARMAMAAEAAGA